MLDAMLLVQTCSRWGAPAQLCMYDIQSTTHTSVECELIQVTSLFDLLSKIVH